MYTSLIHLNLAYCLSTISFHASFLYLFFRFDSKYIDYYYWPAFATLLYKNTAAKRVHLSHGCLLKNVLLQIIVIFIATKKTNTCVFRKNDLFSIHWKAILCLQRHSYLSTENCHDNNKPGLKGPTARICGETPRGSSSIKSAKIQLKPENLSKPTPTFSRQKKQFKRPPFPSHLIRWFTYRDITRQNE